MAWPVALAALLVAPLLNRPALADLPKVPDGFKIRLVAAVPAVQYPCQVATAPDGSLFVGEDPMDQVGPGHQADRPHPALSRRQRARRLRREAERDLRHGLARRGTLRDEHAQRHRPARLRWRRQGRRVAKSSSPTWAFRPALPTTSTTTSSRASRLGLTDIFIFRSATRGFPRPPGPTGERRRWSGAGYCAAGSTARGLEVYSTGTRNHLEPNLDDRDNLFTYDNTDDGLGWWTRRDFSRRRRLFRLSARLSHPDRPHAAPDRRVRRRLAVRRRFLRRRRLARKVSRLPLLGRVGPAGRPRLPVCPRRRELQDRREDRVRRARARSTASARSTWPSATTEKRSISPTGRWEAGATRPKSWAGCTR